MCVRLGMRDAGCGGFGGGRRDGLGCGWAGLGGIGLIGFVWVGWNVRADPGVR